MEKIILYDEIPDSKGHSVYLRINETDPTLYLSLFSKGYKIINKISDVDESTIYITGRRQDFECVSNEEYRNTINNGIESMLMTNGIVKPKTYRFSYNDLIEHKYNLPFVLKNENQNGGREKFLINTEEDYENLIKACDELITRKLMSLPKDDLKYSLDYKSYLDLNFSIQEYIVTPSIYNTTIRLLTSPSNDLLYGSLKYNEPEKYIDDTTLLGYLLSDVYPLSTKSIVSNTLSGGENILLGESDYSFFERELLNSHDINSSQFSKLVEATENVHERYKSELGIICGFDYIYDVNRQQWFLLEYHSRPMVGDYSKRQGINYVTEIDRLRAEGRVRATSLALTLKKIKS